jgi:hypothetical protein
VSVIVYEASAIWVTKERVSGAMADALCQPRVATVSEQMMGSVNSTILGSARFICFRQHRSEPRAISTAVRSRRPSYSLQLIEP